MGIGLTVKFQILITNLLLLAVLTGCGGGGDGGNSSSSSVTTPLPAPSALTYDSPQTYAINTAIAALNPTVTGTVSSYSVSPALPTGLVLNTANGQIAGTPIVAIATATYTITASNSSGSTTFVLSITVNAPPALDQQMTASGVVDPEFDMYSNRYTYCEQSATQSTGKLWIGRFNPDGSFDDYNAHSGGVPIDDCLFQINGPEWGRDNSGAVISYVKNDVMGNPTLAYVHEDSPGNWSTHLVPNLPALTVSYNAVYPSDAANTTARVLFIGLDGLEWRDLGGGPVPGAGGDLVSTEQGFPRWATQSNYIALLANTGLPATRQLVVYNTDDASTTQISFDAGDKNNPHMWVDPNWGMIVTAAVGNNYVVYQLSTKNKMVTIASPNGRAMQSPEHFVYQGHSYIYYYVQNDATDGTKNNDVYITSIEANYKHLKVSDSQLISRIEPEVAFPSPGIPIIFFSAKGADGKNNAVWRSAVMGLP